MSKYVNEVAKLAYGYAILHEAIEENKNSAAKTAAIGAGAGIAGGMLSQTQGFKNFTANAANGMRRMMQPPQGQPGQVQQPQTASAQSGVNAAVASGNVGVTGGANKNPHNDILNQNQTTATTQPTTTTASAASTPAQAPVPQQNTNTVPQTPVQGQAVGGNTQPQVAQQVQQQPAPQAQQPVQQQQAVEPQANPGDQPSQYYLQNNDGSIVQLSKDDALRLSHSVGDTSHINPYKDTLQRIDNQGFTVDPNKVQAAIDDGSYSRKTNFELAPEAEQDIYLNREVDDLERGVQNGTYNTDLNVSNPFLHNSKTSYLNLDGIDVPRDGSNLGPDGVDQSRVTTLDGKAIINPSQLGSVSGQDVSNTFNQDMANYHQQYADAMDNRNWVQKALNIDSKVDGYRPPSPLDRYASSSGATSSGVVDSNVTNGFW